MGVISKVLGLKTEIDPYCFEQPIFVIGCMRSGTSLLQNILDEHPQLLKIGFELNDIWSAIGGANCSHTCEHKTAADIDMAAAHNMTNYFSESIREAKTITRHLERFKNRITQGSGGVFYDWENLIPINKSPHLMNKVGYLSAMYPNARFVLIIRSVFGHSSSMKTHFDKDYKERGMVRYLPKNEYDCWSVLNDEEAKKMDTTRCYPYNFEMIPRAWMRLNRIAITELNQLADDRYVILSYENLVRDQYNVLKRLFGFLNLHEKHKNVEEELFSRSRKLMNNHTGNPLYSWKDKLSQEELAIINSVVESNEDTYQLIKNSLIPSAREKWEDQYKVSEEVLEMR